MSVKTKAKRVAPMDGAHGHGLLGCHWIDSGSWPRYRYVCATKDTSPGDVVCRAPAYAATVCEEWKRRVCAACFTIADARLSQSCPKCDQCYYCDERCQERHKLSHSRVCPALQGFAQLKRTDKETMAVLRLLLEVLAIEHTTSGGTSTFDALQHHPAQFNTSKEVTEWSKCCACFRELCEACAWCPWTSTEGQGETPPPPPTDEELHALTSRIDCNCFGVFRPGCGDGRARMSMGRNVDLLGRGLYLEAALFNHSCAPNCFVSAGALSLEVIADETVSAGDELCISYCDIQQPLAQRQKMLHRAYHFECSCDRCTSEAAPHGAKPAKLSYNSRGGSKKPPATKRERRERREERGRVVGASAASISAEGMQIHISVDLRVLLKLTKVQPHATTTGTATSTSGRRRAAPSARVVQEPRCCVFLKCQAVAPPTIDIT